MNSGRSHDRAKRDGATGVRDPEPSGRDRRRTLQQAAGNQALASLAGGSTPLASGPREALEQQYDVDLGRVRLHTGEAAAREASAQDAAAFTRGDDVYLGHAAERNPLVIGHELVHAIQQTRRGAGASEAQLETEASSVSEGASDAIAGSTSFGSVQRVSLSSLLGLDDEEEKARETQRRDEDAEALVKRKSVLEITGEWKKYIDDPQIAGWLRAHPDKFDPGNKNTEFRAWLKNPKDRPSGATATPQPPPAVEPRKDVAIPRTSGKLARDLERRGEKAAILSWTPQERAMHARAQVEEVRRKHFEEMIPKKGSFEEASWIFWEEVGLHSFLRAYTGETEWAQPLTPGERFSEAVLGGAKAVQTGLLIASAVPEIGPVEGAGAVRPQYAEELLGGAGRETLTMVPTEAEAAQRGAQTLGRTGQAAEELATGAEKTVPKGQDVVLPQRPFGPPEFPPQIAPPEPTPITGAGQKVNLPPKPFERVSSAQAEQLAKSVQGKRIPGQVVEGEQSLFGPPKASTPRGSGPAGGAPEVEFGGRQRLQPKAAPQVLPEGMPEPMPQPPKLPPKLQVPTPRAGQTGAGEIGWAEEEAQAAKERFGPKPNVPMPFAPSVEVEAAKKLSRAGVRAAPLIEKQERKLPAAEERPPITEKEQPPLMVIDPEKPERVQFPAPQRAEEGRKELPPAIKPEEGEEMIAAAQKGKKKKSKLEKQVEKEVEEAFKEPKGKVDIRKTPPAAEESEPRSRKPALSKRQGELLGAYEGLADKKVPKVVDDVLANQEATPTRKRLGVLKDRFDDLMREVGDGPVLTEAQRKRAAKILEEARDLARGDFDTVQESIWRRLRQDPDLLEIEKKLRTAKVVGPGEGALQIKTKPIGGTGVEFESLTLEHGVRLSDNPWLYNSRDNLFVTDASQNEQYLEAVRRGGIWPTSDIEDFVVRHKLSAQKTVFAPGSRPIPQKQP
jgi:hypothetical protein